MSYDYLVERKLRELGKIPIDYMGYRVYDINQITFHHIINRSKGGKDNAKNGALLMKEPHRNLHLIEIYDPKLYEEYAYWFDLINESGVWPNREILPYIYGLKERLENDLENLTVLKRAHKEEKIAQSKAQKRKTKSKYKR